MNFNTYHCCAVSECKNTSIKTPGKLWIRVPHNVKKRNVWLKLARRDPKTLSIKSPLYFCEDHFDLKYDMENYMRYKIMGSVKKILMKPNCVPTRFDFQEDKQKSSPSELDHALSKREKNYTKDKLQEYSEDNVKPSLQSYSQQVHVEVDICNLENTYASTEVKYESIQISPITHYINNEVQIDIKEEDVTSSPFEPTASECTATSPLEISEDSPSELSTDTQSTMTQKSQFSVKEKYDIDGSYLPCTGETTVDCVLSNQSYSSSDTSSQDEFNEVKTSNLLNTLSKIKNKPKLYIGLPKELYFLIGLIEKHTQIPEQNILLCLVKIKLNRTFSELADDFDLSVLMASNIFFHMMPEIVKVLSPFIKQFSTATIKNNLPVAFCHKYNDITCIINYLEIEIKEPTDPVHKTSTWSQYKKMNTIKYLIASTPDSLVRFVSPGYAGGISDEELIEQSTLLERLQPGTSILTDWGSKQLDVYLKRKGFILLRLPNVSVKTKLLEVNKQTEQTASLRLHVETVMRRLRKFAMLKLHSCIDSNLIGLLDLCVTTACALINLHDGRSNYFIS